MPVSASITFTQSAVSPGPGISMIGVGGALITLDNADDTDVISWTWEFLDVPVNSALSKGLIGNLASETFTPDSGPDTPGCYRVRLIVIGSDGTSACDVKNFCVPTSQGWILPPFKATAAELNFPGNIDGWETLLNTIFLDLSSGAYSDELVKVTAADTTEGYLAAKLAAGTNVSFATLNPGANEQLEISATDELAAVSATDTTPDYLDQKVVAGDGITITTLNPGGDEELEINSDFVDPMTTQGDMIIHTAGAPDRLAGGTVGQFLVTQLFGGGPQVVPEWTTVDIPPSDGWVEFDSSEFLTTSLANNIISVPNATSELIQLTSSGVPLRILVKTPRELDSSVYTGTIAWDNLSGFGPENITSADRIIRASIEQSGSDYWVDFYSVDYEDASYLLASTATFTGTGVVSILANSNGISGSITVSAMPTGPGIVYLDFYQYCLVEDDGANFVEISGYQIPTGTGEIQRVWYGDSDKIISTTFFVSGDFQASGSIDDVLETIVKLGKQWNHPRAAVVRARAKIMTGTLSGGQEPDIKLMNGTDASVTVAAVPIGTWTQSLVTAFSTGDALFFNDKEDIEIGVTVNGGTAEDLSLEIDWVSVK